MVFYKLYKFDKIFISIILVIVFLLCFSNFCFAYDIPLTRLNNLYVSSGFLVSQEGRYGLYFPVVKGYSYTIKNNVKANISLSYCTDVPSVGSRVTNLYLISPESTYTFTASSDSYVYVFAYSSSSLAIDNFSVSLDNVDNGFQYFIFRLSDSLRITDFWSVFTSSVPYILIVIVSSFGFYLFFRMIRGLSKGKGRI